jgi:hypothetical protein
MCGCSVEAGDAGVWKQDNHQEQLFTLAELASIMMGIMIMSFLQFGMDEEITPHSLQILFSVSAGLTVCPPSFWSPIVPIVLFLM